MLPDTSVKVRLKKNAQLQSGKEWRQIEVPRSVFQGVYFGKVFDDIIPEASESVDSEKDVYHSHPDDRVAIRMFQCMAWSVEVKTTYKIILLSLK